MKKLQGCERTEHIEDQLLSINGEASWADLADHLGTCEACRQKVSSEVASAALADDLRWAKRVRDEVSIDVNVPLARLNSLLGDDYEIIEEIGRGGMGIVFKARQRELDRVVALKVLPALLAIVKPDAMARFRREATLASRLQHTNIIPIFDFGLVDGTLYYSMPLIEGRSLRMILAEVEQTGAIDVVLGSAVGSRGEQPVGVCDRRERTPRDETAAKPVTRFASSANASRAYYRRVAGWIADVAKALDYAHQSGVIHRDIKPSNLLLGSDGRLMIADFGLAKATGVETMTASHSLLGTARYMSPEQVDESLGPIDHRVDIYGLGATLYELLAFRPLFAASDDREALNQVLNREPLPPHKFIKQVPRELETICLKAIEKDRGNRYATAAEMADDLRRWLLDLPIAAQRPSLATRTVKFVRRRKLLAAMGLACLALLTTAGFLYAGYEKSQQAATLAKSDAVEQELRALLLQASSDYDAARLETGLASVEAALAIRPDLVKGQMLKADFLRGLGRIQEAIRHYEEIVERNPDSCSAHYAMALAYNQIGDERAAYHQQQVERLRPEGARALYLRALFETDPQRAIGFLSAGLELEPCRVEFVMARSGRHYELRQYDAALVDAERATSLLPNWAGSYVHKGKALFHLGRYEEAVRAFGRAIELEAAPAIALMWRGMVYEIIGSDRLALADYDEVNAQESPASQYAKLWKYILLRRNGQDKAAMAVLATTSELEGDITWTGRLSNLLAGNLSGGDLLGVATTDWQRCEAHYYIAMKALLEGNTDQAKDSFEACIATNQPGFLETDFARARLKQLESLHRY